MVCGSGAKRNTPQRLVERPPNVPRGCGAAATGSNGLLSVHGGKANLGVAGEVAEKAQGCDPSRPAWQDPGAWRRAEGTGRHPPQGVARGGGGGVGILRHFVF